MVADCCYDIPFAAIGGCILCVVGSMVMCGTLFRAVSVTDYQISRALFQVEVGWFVVIQIVAVAIAIVVSALAVLVTIFGFLAKRATRKKLYRGEKCIMGGSTSAQFFVTVSYIINLGWIVSMCLQVVPVLCWWMFRTICYQELVALPAGTQFNYVFNITRYGIYRNITVYGGREALTDQYLFGEFCNQVSYVGPLYAAALVATLFVILGLIVVIASSAASNVRLKYVRELTEYRQAEATIDDRANILASEQQPFGFGGGGGGGSGGGSGYSPFPYAT